VLPYEGSFYNTSPAIPGQFASTIVGHANSEGAIATAASWYRTTPAFGNAVPVAEYFSSLGGTRILFDKKGNRIAPQVRRKPDFTAPDGGNTSFFTSDDAGDDDSHPNFFGTSAAAPHAAGVAALMIDAQKIKTITPSQIRGILAANTYDMDNRFTPGFDKGFDWQTGTGLIKADKAVGAVKFPNVFIKNLDLVSLCSDEPTKIRNWKIVNPNPFEVEVHWFLTGFNQNNKLSVPPGDTYFSTKTAYYRNFAIPNIVIMDWEDNFGFTKMDIAAAVNNRCRNDASVRILGETSATVPLLKEDVIKPEIAEVYPNPSHARFRLYLSLSRESKAEIRIYSNDGKSLYANTVPGSGVYDIDASKYKPGLYLMKITQGDFVKTLKLIKQ
jgi:hypothetical protein